MTTRLLAAMLLFSAAAFTAPAFAFDWKQASGTEITLLASEHAWPIAPNLVAQDLTADGPDRKWGADISYI